MSRPEKGFVSTPAQGPAPSLPGARKRTIRIRLGEGDLIGDLAIPDQAKGLVMFAHGSGSSRLSPRNRYVADILTGSGLATLLVDLLTAEEESIDLQTNEFRFNIDLLAERLIGLTDWRNAHPDLSGLSLGYFGASTGSAAALIAAASCSHSVRAVVSRGGRPDLAVASLPRVQAPTLFIVGGDDVPVLEWNWRALALLPGTTHLEIVPGATHLFEEPGAMESVAQMTAAWFRRYFKVGA